MTIAYLKGGVLWNQLSGWESWLCFWLLKGLPRTYHHLVCRSALAAAIAAGIGMGIVPQLLLFFCVSLVLLFFTRPAALKLMRKDTEKTNVEGLLGKKAVVIQKINNLAQTGQVRINDIEWMARTSDDSVTIPVDTVVIIKAVHGVKLIVEPKEA